MAAKLAGSSVAPGVGLSTGLLECPHRMVAASPLREQESNGYVLGDPFLEVAHRHFYTSHWSHRLAPFSVELDYTKAWTPEGKDL